MSRVVLSHNFSIDNWIDYFDTHSSYFTANTKRIRRYQDDMFVDIVDLGLLEFPDGNKISVYIARTDKPLNERSYRKKQYDKSVEILKENNTQAGLFVFYDKSFSFRFSLVYPVYYGTKRTYSNYRRYSFYIQQGKPYHTYQQQLVFAKFDSLDSVKEAFALEPVTKEFYTFIAQKFSELVGGDRVIGSRNVKFERLITYPGNDIVKSKEFSVRLIGRLIFCWFLKNKISSNGVPLIPEKVLSVDGVRSKHQFSYYHSILEPLFFEVLNKPLAERIQQYQQTPWDQIPFLNGGLFESDDKDFYKLDDLGNSFFLNTLKIPDQWFIELYEGFDRYNFTIDESSSIDIEISIDPEMLGRVFENLLAEINPETGESARKATGSYYTPRAIVSYMVDQSLIHYLIANTDLTQELIEDLVSSHDFSAVISEPQIGKIIESLDTIRILDPACGSGAFLMGLLHRMLFIINRIDPNLMHWKQKLLDSIQDNIFKEHVNKQLKYQNFEYIIKLGLIRNSIFGIDIQPIAVEISRLRLFLSLIVDESIDDKADNRGILSLPNLDFKIVAANSLIDLPLDVDTILVSYIDQLAELRNEYFSANSTRKAEIAHKYISVRNELAKQAGIWQDKNKNLLKLVAWDPFSNDKCDWFEPKWMFGFDKFDIVITNPPYLGEREHKEVFRAVRQGSLKEFYMGKMDLFYFFIHLALNITHPNGVVAFITTNYFITADGALKLRQDLKNRSTLLQLINFNELKIFQSALGQHNMITICQRNNSDSDCANTSITTRTGIATNDILESIMLGKDFMTQYYSVPFVSLFDTSNCYIRLTSAQEMGISIENILNSIKNNERLGDVCHINQGVVSGCDFVSAKDLLKFKNLHQGDGIFVLDLLKERDLWKIGTFNDNEKELLKPFFKNSDISRYWSKSISDKLLLYYKGKLDEERFPNVLKHLQEFQPILEERLVRYGEKYHWTSLHRSRDETIFTSSKIVVPYRTCQNTFTYNETDWFCSADCYIIKKKDTTLSLKYILALLNSKLYYVWLYHRGKRKGNTLELYKTPLSAIPIKRISTDDQNEFINLVDEIMMRKSENPNSNTSEMEHKIDRLVYDLYCLTEDEISLIESFNV